MLDIPAFFAFTLRAFALRAFTLGAVYFLGPGIYSVYALYML